MEGKKRTVIFFFPSNMIPEMELASEAETEVLHSWGTPSCLVTVQKPPNGVGGGGHEGVPQCSASALASLKTEKWPWSDVFHTTQGKNMGFLWGLYVRPLLPNMNEWTGMEPAAPVLLKCAVSQPRIILKKLSSRSVRTFFFSTWKLALSWASDAPGLHKKQKLLGWK